jgi:hypothetical protein
MNIPNYDDIIYNYDYYESFFDKFKKALDDAYRQLNYIDKQLYLSESLNDSILRFYESKNWRKARFHKCSQCNIINIKKEYMLFRGSTIALCYECFQNLKSIKNIDFLIENDKNFIKYFDMITNYYNRPSHLYFLTPFHLYFLYII